MKCREQSELQNYIAKLFSVFIIIIKGWIQKEEVLTVVKSSRKFYFLKKCLLWLFTFLLKYLVKCTVRNIN